MFTRCVVGVLNSHSTQTFRIDSAEHRISLDQTITYTECRHQPGAVDSIRVAVSRNFFTYSGEENIVRYSQTNRVPGTGTPLRYSLLADRTARNMVGIAIGIILPSVCPSVRL